MKFSVLIFLFFSTALLSQEEVLFVGNTAHICIDSLLLSVSTSKELPEDLNPYGVIFIFSNARSVLSGDDQIRLLDFLKKGNGLYLGSENWPLQAESNQLTEALYTKRSWGNFDGGSATSDSTGLLKDIDTFPAGNTTVAFPLDYRLKVEAWVNDEPLILSGQVYEGRLIIDGGYSRFYCSALKEENKRIMKCFVDFLR